MLLVNKLYDWLSQGPSPDCDRILAAGLPRAEAQWRERIVAVLLARQNAAAWGGLIAAYDQLDEPTRAHIRQQRDHFYDGVALAYKSSDAEARANALRALADAPCIRMFYLLSQAVRDPAPRVRALAGGVLRQAADAFLAALETDRPLDHCGEIDEARRRAVLALDEALRTFDLHHRNEVLEVALWFAEDLGPRLWQRLETRRSRVRVAVAEQLASWNGPRLAYFLVTALTRPDWRRNAARLLAGWQTPEQIKALLEQSDLLDDPEIRRNLSAVHEPRWFDRLDPRLRLLPEHLRPLAPRWTCHAGFSEARRASLLSRWVDSDDPELHKAAVYALAEIDSPTARAILQQVADSDSPLATFARWCVVALETEIVKAALNAPLRGRTEHPATPATPQEQAASDDCTMLWQACRRTPPAKRGPLIAALREHADVWRPQLQAYMRSPDPRDRILALQVVSTEKLALRFRRDLEALLDDPLDGIRHLAQTLIRVLSQQPLLPRHSDEELSVPAPDGEDPERDRQRRKLRAMLEKLSSGQADPSDPKTVERVRELLRQVYGDDPADEQSAEVQP